MRSAIRCRGAMGLCVVGVGAWVALLMGGVLGEKPSGNTGEVYKEGDVVKDFALKDLDGKEGKLSDFKGKVVLIAFFVTWSKPCEEETPVVEKEFWQKYRSKGVQVLGISLMEQADKVKSFRQKHGLTFPIWIAPDQDLFQRFGQRKTPAYVILDHEMKLRDIQSSLDKKAITSKLNELLEKKQSGK